MNNNIMNYGMNPMMNQQNGIMINDRDLFFISNINRNLAFSNLINNNAAQFWMLRAQQMNRQMQMMLNMFQAGAPAAGVPAIAPAAGAPAIAPAAGAPAIAPAAGVPAIAPAADVPAIDTAAGVPAIATAAGALAIAPAAGAPVVAPGAVIHIVPVRRRGAHNLAASQRIYDRRPQLDRIEVRDLTSSQQIRRNINNNA